MPSSDEEEGSGFGSDDGFMDSDMEEDDNEYGGYDPTEDIDMESRRAAYEVVTEQQLRERQAEALQAVTTVTGVPEDEAIRVLRHFKWDPNRVNEEYFADMGGIRHKLGLVDEPDAGTVTPSTGMAARKGRGRGATKLVLCNICYDEHPPGGMLAAPCQHHYCRECWHGYAASAVSDGPACLDLRCPDPGCKAAVPGELLKQVLDSSQGAKVDQFMLRSFVEDNRQLAWCPAPGCSFAVLSSQGAGGEAVDVACKCGSTFCFVCREEAHRPVDCATVGKWLLKNSAESENLNWIMANTKPCPTCKRPIEKNHGCMHMNCSQCKHEFCWLCLGDWKTHGEATGGFYSCNRYEQGKKEGKYNEEESKRERAKQSLERYMHYFQRFAENDKARKQATAKMQEFADSKIELLSELTATPTSQLKLVLDAWAQVIDCRRILKWTYCFGFYTFAGDEPAAAAGTASSQALSPEQQNFFEYSQGQAESYLEKLHKLVEQDMNDLLDGTQEAGVWPRFRETLIGLTDVTQSHFAKLVDALQGGLSQMLQSYQTEEEAGAAAAAAAAAEAQAAAAKAAAAEASNSKKFRFTKRSRSLRPGGASAGAAGSQQRPIDVSMLDDESVIWSCPACTYANTDLGAARCEMCETPREA